MTADSSHDWQAHSELLNEALELEPAPLQEWLAALRVRDPHAAGHIEELLALRERTGFANFLVDDGAPSLALLDNATLTGRQLGPYIVEAQIGGGGMGSVWRARRTDGRYEGVVAVKFIHASWIGLAGERRFRLEGKVLARLDHPHIARLLDAGMLDDTQPYLVLEFVAGEPIDSYCERLHLDLKSRVKLFSDVLDAVAHAHSRLIVHRDIKPANIFVTHDGSVKLLDFGIAKLLDAEEAAGPLTKSQAAALTPMYAAPEQLQAQVVSTASDVYSLGLVLYVLLTGLHPLGDKTRSTADLIESIVTREPELASSVGALPAIPREALEGDVDNILSKALKKEPQERYASAAAFAEDLQRFLTHQPVRARADTLRYRTQKFVRRHRGGVAAATLTLIAIMAGFAGTLWQAQRAHESAELAERERARAVELLNSAEASGEFLSFLLEQGADKPFTTPELLERGEVIVKHQFADDPAMRAELLWTLADLQAQSGNAEKGEALFRAAKSAAANTGNVVLQAHIDCSLALELAETGKADESLAMLNASIERLRNTAGLEPADLANCLAQRSELETVTGNAVDGLKDAQAALVALGKPRTGQLSEALTMRMALADAQLRTGHAALAVDEYARVIDELTHMGRDQTQFFAEALANLGVVLSKSGQWLRGVDAYRRALATERQVANGARTNSGTLINYAKLLNDIGRAPEALAAIDQAYSIAKHDDNQRAVAMADLLGAPPLCATAKLDECAQRLRRAGAALHQQLHDNNPMWGTYETEEAELSVARGEIDSARSHLRAALKIFQSASERNPNELRALALQTELELRSHDVAAASVDAKVLLDKAREALSGFRESAWLGRALLVQGEVLAAQGKKEDARASLAGAQAMLRTTIGDDAPWTRQATAALTQL